MIINYYQEAEFSPIKATLRPVTILVALCLLAGVADAKDRAFRFLAIGDTPYSAAEVPLLHRLLKQSEKEDFAFLMHVGDIKAGGSPCSDATLQSMRNLFRDYPKPVVYTPGDNEWTDCQAAGGDPLDRLDKLRQLFFTDKKTLRLDKLAGVEPLERLDKLRQLFFTDKKTLRLDKLGVVRQSRQAKFARYVENYRFTKSGVLFVMVHVVGSGNNRRENHTPSMKEYTQRNAANLAFLAESYALARKADVRGVAVVIHANPNFEQGTGAGFKDFLNSLRGFLSTYDRPVVCIHGDSHYYRIDKPFKDANGKTFLGFTRMEVFGSPNVAGVSITVDPDDPQIFSYRPYYLDRR